MTMHFLCSFGYTCCAPASTTRRERAKKTTRDVAQVTCKRCRKMFAGEISQLWTLNAERMVAAEAEALAAARDAQLDAQERDTMPVPCIFCRNAESHTTHMTRAERDAKISELLDDECTLRRLVRDREQLTSTHKQNAFRNGRVHRSALKAYYASKDLLDLEVAKLNSVRGQLCVLSPAGSYAIRRADESIAFVTIP